MTATVATGDDDCDDQRPHLNLAVPVADVDGSLGVERRDVGNEAVRPEAQHQPLHDLRVVLMYIVDVVRHTPKSNARHTTVAA